MQKNYSILELMKLKKLIATETVTIFGMMGFLSIEYNNFQN